MFPRNAPNDVTDSGVVHPVLGSKRDGGDSAGCVFGANRSNVIFGQLRQVERFTAPESFGEASGGIQVATRRSNVDAPSLGIHIRNVGNSIAKEQMTGIAARRVIAGMQDPHAIGNRSNVPFVGDAGRDAHASAPSTAPDASISLFVKGTRPAPTGVGVIGDNEESLEPFEKRYLSGHHRGPFSVVVPGVMPVAARLSVAPIIPEIRHIRAAMSARSTTQ